MKKCRVIASNIACKVHQYYSALVINILKESATLENFSLMVYLFLVKRKHVIKPVVT